MEAMHHSFGWLRSALTPSLRTGRAKWRSTQFECLESRAVFSTSPFTIVNNTVGYDGGKFAWLDNQIHVALYSEDSAGANYYYFDAAGNPTLTTTIQPNADNQRLIPTFLLNSLTKTAEHTYVINLPQELPGSSYGPNAARLLFSVDGTIQVTVNADGTVNAPVPDSSFEYYYDFVEFTLNAPNNPVGNLNINTSTIDQFGMPITVLVEPIVDSTLPAYRVGVDALRTDVISQYETFTSGTPFADGVWPTSGDTWGPYRISNPSDVMNNAPVAQVNIRTETFLNNAINATQTTINVDAAGFPDPSAGSFNIRIKDEILTVTGAAKLTNGSTNWTVTRSVNGNHSGHVQFALVKPMGPAVTATQTTLTVVNTTGFPTTYPFRIKVNNEIMNVTGVLSQDSNDGSTTWSVQRGQYGTTAVAHQQEAIATYDSVVELGLNSYFNQAIDDLFTKYHNTADKLELAYTPPGSQVTEIYEGTVTTDANGAYVMQFQKQNDPTGTLYDVYYPFFKQNRYYWAGYTPTLTVSDAPSWATSANLNALSPFEMVFACNGVFADNTFRPGFSSDEQTLLGSLENQIVSALNRGVGQLKSYDSTDPTNTWSDGNAFYGDNGEVFNIYAQFLHQPSISIDGLAYGFAFDDQGGHASDIGMASFSGVTITLGPWGNLPLPHSSQGGTTMSLRDFLASYFSSQSTMEAEPQVEAQSQLAVADPQASPLLAVDAALNTLASDDADLFYAAHFSEEDDSEEDGTEESDADEVHPSLPVARSLRSLLSSRRS